MYLFKIKQNINKYQIMYSNCIPPSRMQAFKKDLFIRLALSAKFTFCATSLICLNSFTLFINYAQTLSFMQPQQKKSRGFKSGDQRGHIIGPNGRFISVDKLNTNHFSLLVRNELDNYHFDTTLFLLTTYFKITTNRSNFLNMQ